MVPMVKRSLYGTMGNDATAKRQSQIVTIIERIKVEFNTSIILERGQKKNLQDQQSLHNC
jgi:hypothetical protein